MLLGAAAAVVAGGSWLLAAGTILVNVERALVCGAELAVGKS